MQKWGLLCLAFLCWIGTVIADDTGHLTDDHTPHASVQLLSSSIDHGHVKLLLNVQLAPGWKTYWQSPGEGGMAPDIEWESDVTKMHWFWPTPSRFEVNGMTTQGYSNAVVFPIELDLPSHTTHLSGSLILPTCQTLCVITDYPFHLDLTAETPPSFDWLFNQAMGAVPPETGIFQVNTAQFDASTDQVLIDLTRTDHSIFRDPELFIEALDNVAWGAPISTYTEKNVLFTLPVTDDWGDRVPDLMGKTISFVIKDGDLAQSITTTLQPVNHSTPATAIVTVWHMIGIALLGGLILNLMPCVLPVLAMKLGSILYLPQGDRHQIRLQFFLSSAGILVSFWLLALLMTFLKWTQQAIGWGIQFQNPWFIGLMGLITAFFSANLFGLFTLQLNSKANTRMATIGGQGKTGAFLHGVFATLLATPCSAPFLGTAVAFALAAPIDELWILFTALGLGMSLPWLMIALFPVVARALPKPGVWMNYLKIVLACMMLLSCFWLISLLIPYIGYALTLGLIVIFVIVMLILAYRKSTRQHTLALAILFFVCTAGYAWLYSPDVLDQQTGRSHNETLIWHPLSEQAIVDGLAANQRIFIDITADWCITCKANKYNVLSREAVQTALSAPDVLLLRGDWTKPSPEITDFLKKRGQVAVPFNQIYTSEHPDGVILPILLDQKTLLSTLQSATGAHE